MLLVRVEVRCVFVLLQFILPECLRQCRGLTKTFLKNFFGRSSREFTGGERGGKKV